MEALNKLTYLKAVQDETLRLYPPVPSNMKTAMKDDVLPNGYVIHKGTEVAFNTYTIHREEKYWGSDALEFKPERWINPTQKIHPFQYFPFHGGPRLCLGMKMAYIEASLLTALILKRFSLQLVPGHPVEPKPAITMPAKYGMKMYVRSTTCM